MRQRVVINLLIEQDDGTVLLVRRPAGEASAPKQYEVPMRRLQATEDPAAAAGSLAIEFLKPLLPPKLVDVASYVDERHSPTHYVAICYKIAAKSVLPRNKLPERYTSYQWVSLSQLHQYSLSQSALLLLNLSQHQKLTDESAVKTADYADKKTSSITIFSDGGSRGNPGPSAAGFVIVAADGQVLSEGGEYLGLTTNNQAEYHGVRLGLEEAIRLGIRDVNFKIDSMLVVNQLNGLYIIKNRELWPIHERIKELSREFDRIKFIHVKREFNQLADRAVNKILDYEKRAINKV
ncbi:reverse transcriptase-like protein [Candidatus Saccharibacteria bacterium]|nr:reverse transcriptase-like protein [Candidatus Saccharibacteria bacterium]